MAETTEKINTPQTTQEGTAKNNTKAVVNTADIAKAQAVQTAGVTAPVQSQAEKLAAMEAELKAIELESAKLELELKKANLVDTKERLAERELKREAIRQEAYTKGATIARTKSDEEKQQARCNHKKGGNGAAGVIGGQGDDSQYAVLKHKFANGDIWVRCLRCGKTWKKPVRSEHSTEESYIAATAKYEEAVNFQTRNVTSGGVIFQFSDGGEYYREQTKNANLR